MSLFTRNYAFASIEADRFACVRVSGTRPREAFGSQFDDAAGLHYRAEEALRPLKSALLELAWRRTVATVIVSDRLVRYFTISRPYGLRSERELKLAVETQFEQAFDASVTDWLIALHAPAFATQYVACAIARTLVAAIRDAFSSLTCIAIQPFLVSELNRHMKSAPRNCWYVACGRDYVAIAQIIDNHTRAIRVVPFESENQRIGELVSNVQLLAPDHLDAAPVVVSGFPLTGCPDSNFQRVDAAQWHGKPEDWCSEYRLALSPRWP